MALSIDYKLTGSGWAECTIADGGQSCTITASYLSDAFGNLVRSAVAMLYWFNFVSFSFLEEPGEFVWELETNAGNAWTLNLKLLGIDCDRDSATSESDFKPLFQTVCSQMEFGKAVRAAGEALLEKHGEQGYFEEWVEFPFPTDEFRQLIQRLEYFSQFPSFQTGDT